MSVVRFVGPSYHLKNRKAGVQRSINLYPVTNEVQGGKSETSLVSVPGLRVFSEDDIPTPPEPSTLWLDLFNGPMDTVLTDHAMDMPLNGSTWNNPDSDMWLLSGDGSAFAPVGSIGVYTEFASQVLLWGWRWELDLTLPSSRPVEYSFFELTGDSGSIATLEYRDGEPGDILRLGEAMIPFPFDTYAGQAIRMRFVFNQESVEVFVNDASFVVVGLDDGYVPFEVVGGATMWSRSYVTNTQVSVQRQEIIGIKGSA